MTTTRILGAFGVAVLMTLAAAPAARAEGEHGQEAREKRVTMASHKSMMRHSMMMHHRMMHHRSM